MKNKTYKQKGFSLIEVMLAVLVLAIGILAVSKLQTSLIRSGSDANHRAVAASIAQKKINDLRRFVYTTTSDLSTPIEWDNLAINSVTSLKYPLSLAFAHIETNKGGRIQADDILSGDHVYSLSWTSDAYTYPTTNSIATLAGVSDDSAFKRVHVVVQWDSVGDNTNNVVSFDTIIDSYDFENTDLASTVAAPGTGPQAKYTPQAAPDVIKIDVGDGKLRETDKPTPTVYGGGDNTLVDFAVVTYHSDGNDFIKDREEEFRTVDCSCTFSSDDDAYPPAHNLWDGVNREDYVGPKIEKLTATEDNNDSAVVELCTACCRDHHDDDASDVKYVADTTSGDHKHYNSSGIFVTTGDYVESCRFKRVDGVFRVFQDWDLKDVIVAEQVQFADLTTLQMLYTSYQNDFILNSVTTANTISNTKPTLGSPVSISLNGSTQLAARGVYIDNVYTFSGEENPASYIEYIASASKTNRLEIIPFAEVNLTLLAQWNSSNAGNVSVTNEAIDTIPDPANNYYGAFSRGYISALNPTTADITASLRDNNDGFTQLTYPPTATYTNLSDTVRVNVGAAGSPFTLAFNWPQILYPAGGENFSSTTIIISNTATNVQAADCNTNNSNAAAYPTTCTVNGPWSGTVTLSTEISKNGNNAQYNCTGSMTLTYSGINSAGSPITLSPQLTCQGP